MYVTDNSKCFHILTCLFLTNPKVRTQLLLFHVTHVETEAQRGQVFCARSHSVWWNMNSNVDSMAPGPMLLTTKLENLSEEDWISK